MLAKVIRRVHFASFRALRDVWLDLCPFTVLVGPNASGKSSALDGLQSTYGLMPQDQWRGVSPTTLTFEFDDGRRLTRTINSGGLAFSSAVVHFDLAQMRAARRVSSQWELDRTGSQLVNAFATLPRSAQTDVAEELARLVPAIGDVHHRPGPSEGEHRLVFQDRWESSLWYEPGQVSDGTICALAYLVLAHQQKAPQLLCIEEPERSMHPYLLGQIIALLRSLSTGGRGAAPIQIVIATQSADLLDHVDASEVRFFTRTEDGSVEIRAAPTDQPGWSDALREYSSSIGQMWLSGGLGGVPAV